MNKHKIKNIIHFIIILLLIYNILLHRFQNNKPSEYKNNQMTMDLQSNWTGRLLSMW